jgi:release factor glutamine methyltransferase
MGTLRPVGTRRHAPATSGGSVYPPREDTELLRPFARVGPGARLLDIGTGSGALALEAARGGARVVATDLNPFALRVAAGHGRAEALRVDWVRTDLARGLGRFDRVLVNPPYLPTEAAMRDPDPWTNLALDGGPDGTDVTRRVVLRLAEHLVPEGSAYLLVSSLQAPGSLAELWRTWRRAGGRARAVARRRLEGEVLSVWRLDAPAPPISPSGRSTRRPRPGTGGRPRTPRRRRSGSSRATGNGRTSARGAASARRRSRPGS